MTDELEKQIINLVATDRIDMPISSMSGKLKRQKPKLAKAINLDDNKYVGERVYANLVEEDRKKARGMREGIELFKSYHPKYGEILEKYISEEREVKENHLYFGVNPGCRLTADDYMNVMTALGFSETTAVSLYPELMNVSRKLTRARDEERSIMVG